MSDPKTQPTPALPDPTEAMHRVANFCATAVSYSGTDSLLDARDGYLRAWEHMAADWLTRRHEAGEDTRKLLARLRDSRDIHEFISAHHDWYSATLQRLVVDCASWVPLAMAGMARLPASVVGEVAGDQVRDDMRAGTGTSRTGDRPRPPGAASAALRSASAGTLLPARADRSSGDGQRDAEVP